MSHWLLLLVFHSLREHDLFLSPIVGSNCDLSGDFLCSYLSSQDLQQSSSRSSSSSDDDYEPLDCSNSFYCPLCASRWKYLSCIFHCFDCSNPLSVQQVPPKPKEGKFSDPQRRRAPMNLEEPLKTLTEATDTDLRYCPFHKYRENVQFYGYFTLFATSLWFFLWPLAHPVEIFTLYFVYDIVWAYLPFLFLLCLFRQRVEYDKNFPTTQQLGDHFSPELMERNIETVLEYLH